MAKRVVIIGGVAGGASCAARLRRLDEAAEIVLLERGEFISYANCGLPYHVGGTIKSREALLLQTPEAMRQKINVDVRVQNEVTAINRKQKTVSVRKTHSGEQYELPYDTLVISTGSSPFVPPISGIDSPRIQTLWTVPDAVRIREMLTSGGVREAAVVGGGFIGLEMAENLRNAGADVTIIEATNQVMAPLDYEMAQLLHENIVNSGVKLYLSDGVSSFSDDGKDVTISLNSGKALKAQLVLVSAGVRPNSALAREAGLELNERGGIVTDNTQKTSDPDIYAVGDVVEVADFVFGGGTMVPLAGPANKQGRIAADNIAGGSERYAGTQGTSVAKVFELTAASTGANEKTLIRRGLKKGADYQSIIITQNSHAGYYPGAKPLTLKLLFAADGGKIYGAQIVGRDGVDKRIDTIATAMRLGAEVHALTQLELAYAPPYSSAKDPVNMAGFTAENLLAGLVRFAEWDAAETDKNTLLLDVREDAELMGFELPNAVHIPLGQLREKLSQLDKTKHIIIFCAIGVRAYNAARILMNNGFANVSVYPGGVRFYRSTHFEQYSDSTADNSPVEDSGHAAAANADSAVRLDCSGLQCPGPLMKVFEKMQQLREGETLEVLASDPGFTQDIGAWCRRTGNTLISTGRNGTDFTAVVKKGGEKPTAPAAAQQGKTIIVFSGDLDRVLASFIIANGAAAMGRPVTMFFTFWGLTALRRPKKQRVKKSAVEAMFGAMLPRGTGKLKLSKMNMGGMGTAMMKKIMNDKNVDSLEALIQKALANGVKIVACTMSMDVMGIKPEELIDGVQLGGVGAYLGDAEESDVNLFI